MKNIELDFAGLTKQFEGLNGRHPGLWPIAPKALLLTGVVTTNYEIGRASCRERV